MSARIAVFAGLVTLGVTGAGVAIADDSGEAVYKKTCTTCHGANGKGMLPGVPDLTNKAGVLSQPDDLLVKRITTGYQSPGSPMAMPPKGGNPQLTEAQLREALRYIRAQFGK